MALELKGAEINPSRNNTDGGWRGMKNSLRYIRGIAPRLWISLSVYSRSFNERPKNSRRKNTKSERKDVWMRGKGIFWQFSVSNCWTLREPATTSYCYTLALFSSVNNRFHPSVTKTNYARREREKTCGDCHPGGGGPGLMIERNRAAPCAEARMRFMDSFGRHSPHFY